MALAGDDQVTDDPFYRPGELLGFPPVATILSTCGPLFPIQDHGRDHSDEAFGLWRDRRCLEGHGRRAQQLHSPGQLGRLRRWWQGGRQVFVWGLLQGLQHFGSSKMFPVMV